MQEDIREVCRRFRKNQTKAEKAFWKVARNRQISGYKILRQYPIKFHYDNKNRFFIADFYCHEAILVIELDGGIHETQKGYDKLREQIMYNLGYNFVRFSNYDVLNQIEDVIDRLLNTIVSRK